MWATQKREWPGVRPFSVVSPRLTWSSSQWNVHRKVQILSTEIMSGGKEMNPLILFLTLSKFPFSPLPFRSWAMLRYKLQQQDHLWSLRVFTAACSWPCFHSWVMPVCCGEELVGFITTRPLVCYFALKMEAAKFSEMSADQPVTAQEWKEVRWLFFCAECVYL
jgi:hypothetical protein